MEEIHHRRRAQARAVEQRRHIEAENARAEVQLILVIVEQPGMLAIVDPRVEARLEIAGLRTTTAAQKLLEITKPSERRIMIEAGVDRRGDRSELFRPFGTPGRRTE